MNKEPLIYNYIEDDIIHYCYKSLFFPYDITLSGPLGQGLMSFFWPEKDFSQLVFQLFYSFISGEYPTTLSAEKSFVHAMPLAEKSPYLFICLDVFLAASRKNSISMLNIINEKFDFSVPIEPSDNLITVFSDYLAQKQAMVREELEPLLDNIQESDSALQMLYLMSLDPEKKNTHFSNLQFRTSLRPVNYIDFNSYDEALTAFQEDNTRVVEMYELDTFDDLIRFELLQMLSHEILFKRCKCCHNFFIPTGYSNAEYCGRTIPPNQKPCNEIGATLVHQQKTANNPIHQAYLKAYRRMDSQKRAGKISKDYFSAWSKEARKLRANCEEGIITLEEFIEWLDQTRYTFEPELF